MFTAFILTGRAIINAERPNLYRRIYRLAVMHTAWALIYFAAFACEAVLFRSGVFAGKGIFRILLSLSAQLLLGGTINVTMWFQADLIYITLMLAAVYLFAERKAALLITLIIMIISFIMQYSGINFALFGDMPYALQWPLGRICEMLPLACTGLLFVNYDVMCRLQKHRTLSIAACVILLSVTVLLRKSLPAAPGFTYSGIYLYFSAVLMTVIFYLLPAERLPDKAKEFIYLIARFTPGVYCMHGLAGGYLNFVNDYVSSSFMYCVVIFAVCICVSFMLSKVSRKVSRYIVE